METSRQWAHARDQLDGASVHRVTNLPVLDRTRLLSYGGRCAIGFIDEFFSSMRFAMKILTEPLLHFAVAGVVLFSAYAWLNGSRPASDGVEPVRIGAGQIQWLKQTYSSQWLRPPDATELQGLVVADLVNEELLAREAQAMGLGENDTIYPSPAGPEAEVPRRGYVAAGRADRRGAAPVFRGERGAFRRQPPGVILADLFQSGKPQGRGQGRWSRPCRAER